MRKKPTQAPEPLEKDLVINAAGPLDRCQGKLLLWTGGIVAFALITFVATWYSEWSKLLLDWLVANEDSPADEVIVTLIIVVSGCALIVLRQWERAHQEVRRHRGENGKRKRIEEVLRESEEK